MATGMVAGWSGLGTLRRGVARPGHKAPKRAVSRMAGPGPSAPRPAPAPHGHHPISLFQPPVKGR